MTALAVCFINTARRAVTEFPRSAWELEKSCVYLVPKLQFGNAYYQAPLGVAWTHIKQSLKVGIPKRSLGMRQNPKLLLLQIGLILCFLDKLILRCSFDKSP
jgi:hypothetical protein